MVGAVKPRDVEKGALLLIPAAAIIGAIALFRGNWIVVAAMVLVILGQALVFRRARASSARRE